MYRDEQCARTLLKKDWWYETPYQISGPKIMLLKLTQCGIIIENRKTSLIEDHGEPRNRFTLDRGGTAV